MLTDRPDQWYAADCSCSSRRLSREDVVKPLSLNQTCFARVPADPDQWYAAALLILFCFQVMPKVSAQTITGSAPVPRLFCKFGQSAFPPMFWCSGAVSTNFSGRQAANPQTLYQRARRRSLLSACPCVVTAFRFSRRPLMTLGGWMLCLGSRMMLPERACTKPVGTPGRCFLFCFPLPLKD